MPACRFARSHHSPKSSTPFPVTGDFAQKKVLHHVVYQRATLSLRVMEKMSSGSPEARLHAIVDATPECIKIVAADGSLTFMNQAGLTMVEASSVEDILGISVFPFITPEDRTKWTEHHNRVCRGESLRWQYEIVGLKGTRRYLETHAVPLPNADGTFSQLAVTRDITQRKVTERELLEAFMRASSDVIYRMSADWNRMYTLDGRSFLADTGIPIDNWVDKYIPDSERPRVRAAIAEAIRTKQPFELEHEVVRADKGVGYTFFRAIPVLNRAGEIVEWLGTATDVTENKRAEAALRAAREESEKTQAPVRSGNEQHARLNLCLRSHLSLHLRQRGVAQNVGPYMARVCRQSIAGSRL
jgi:PAS domain S-box-containing protein